jgi:hypothetical protein
MKPLEFTRGSRKHRIGRASARYVIATAEPVESTDVATGTLRRTWVGTDERGRELEVVAIERPDCWLVIHVMPTYQRRNNP